MTTLSARKMVMYPGEAWRVHAAIAHQLLDTWPVCSNAHQILQSELEGWSQRPAASADEYLQTFIERLRSGGVEQRVLDALDGVQDKFEHIDEYLVSMFDSALVLARDCYQRWADWSATTVELDVTAATNTVYPDPAGFGELGVVACVPPRESPEAPATVKLTFIPGRLGPPSWASVPYLLCHELICHVNQASPMSSEDPFGEGWMDLVALQLHDRWSAQIFPWAPALARSAAARLSEDVLNRWRDLPEPYMHTRGMRSEGRVAARWVEEKLEPFHDPAKAPSELVRLSLQLNRAALTVAGRIEFISKVNYRSNLRLQAGLLAQLRRWIDDAEAEDARKAADRVLSFS